MLGLCAREAAARHQNAALQQEVHELQEYKIQKELVGGGW